MIRTLALIAAVSFVLAIGCLAAAFAITGGPFSIDDGWRFQRGHWATEISDDDSTPPRRL